MHREDDGAVQFWRIKENLQNYFPYCPRWSDSKWKKSMAGGGGNKKRCSLIDPTLQDNVIIPDGFSKYSYHVGCAINLHSIINSGLILGGQKLNNRPSVFFLPVDPMDKKHKDLDTINLNVPRHAQYMHKHGRDIRTQYIGSTSILLRRKDWSFIKHDRTPSFFTKHFQFIVFRKLLGWKLEKSYTKKYTCHLGLHQRSP